MREGRYSDRTARLRISYYKGVSLMEVVVWRKIQGDPSQASGRSLAGQNRAEIPDLISGLKRSAPRALPGM